VRSTKENVQITPKMKQCTHSHKTTSNFNQMFKYGNTILQEDLEDAKEVIRINKSKNDRQHNGEKKRDKRQTEDRVTRTPLKTGGNLGAS